MTNEELFLLHLETVMLLNNVVRIPSDPEKQALCQNFVSETNAVVANLIQQIPVAH